MCLRRGVGARTLCDRPAPASTALDALFPSKSRRAIFELLFTGRLFQASVSELARRAGLTPRAVAVEVEKLSEAGLVEVEAKFFRDLVRKHGHA